MNKKDKVFSLAPDTCGISFSAMLFAYLVFSLIGQLIVGAIFSEGGVAVKAINSTYAVVAMTVVLFFLAKNKNLSFRVICGIEKFSAKYLFYSVLLFVGMFFGLGFLNTFFVDLLSKIGIKVSGISITLENAYHVIIFTFFLAVLPATVEEFFFRGLMLGGLKEVKPLISALFIAVCFSLYHCSLAQLLYQFVYGYALSLLTLSAKSVIPSVIAHFLNNFAVIILQYFNVYIDFFNPLIIIGGMLLLVVFAVLTIFSLKKQKAEKVYASYKDQARAFWSPYLLCGIFVCVLLMILSLI